MLKFIYRKASRLSIETRKTRTTALDNPMSFLKIIPAPRGMTE
jgi:hypothetical protein